MENPIEFDLSVLLLPVKLLLPDIHSFRTQYTVDGKNGLIPHISLLYPFVKSSVSFTAVENQLQKITNDQPAFELYFTELIKDSDKNLLYLRPESNPALNELMTSCQEFWEKDIQKDIFPHLTIAKTRNNDELVRIEEKIRSAIKPLIPFKTTIDEIWFCAETDRHWQTIRSFPLQQ